jgi:3-isopropylmalate dehydrogenase
MITRKGTERVVRFAFELARKRSGAPRDGRRRVTACDKANVLRSYAFFRRVFDDVAARYPDVAPDYAYVDAMTAHQITRPDFYDVVVAENIFGDIISDLGAATVGSMGMSPAAELGDRHGFFQASHGSAPDIMGQGIANPLGTILAGALMLRWLGERKHDPDLDQTAARIEHAVETVLSSGTMLTRDLGGRATTVEMTRAVCEALR